MSAPYDVSQSGPDRRHGERLRRGRPDLRSALSEDGLLRARRDPRVSGRRSPLSGPSTLRARVERRLRDYFRSRARYKFFIRNWTVPRRHRGHGRGDEQPAAVARADAVPLRRAQIETDITVIAPHPDDEVMGPRRHLDPKPRPWRGHIGDLSDRRRSVAGRKCKAPRGSAGGSGLAWIRNGLPRAARERDSDVRHCIGPALPNGRRTIVGRAVHPVPSGRQRRPSAGERTADGRRSRRQAGLRMRGLGVPGLQRVLRQRSCAAGGCGRAEKGSDPNVPVPGGGAGLGAFRSGAECLQHEVHAPRLQGPLRGGIFCPAARRLSRICQSYFRDA